MMFQWCRIDGISLCETIVERITASTKTILVLSPNQAMKNIVRNRFGEVYKQMGSKPIVKDNRGMVVLKNYSRVFFKIADPIAACGLAASTVIITDAMKIKNLDEVLLGIHYVSDDVIICLNSAGD